MITSFTSSGAPRRGEHTMLKSLKLLPASALVAIGLVLGAVTLALGQAGYYQITSPLGTEQVQINSTTSAVNNWVQLNTIRNTTGYQLTASTTGTVAMTAAANRLIFTAASVSATVNLPPSPPDGEMVEIVNGASGAFTQCTVATTDSSTLQGTATTGTLAAAGSVEWQYTAASKIWYRIR
jgi:hypothetical protein